MAKIHIEDIVSELAADNWKVISTEYTNLDTEMIFECPEGHRVFVPWKKLRTKRECPVCKKNAFKKLVEEGDIIRINIPETKLELLVPEEELALGKLVALRLGREDGLQRVGMKARMPSLSAHGHGRGREVLHLL